VTRAQPAEGFRRLVVAVGGRKRAVDVPALTRDELVSAVREQARQGTISFAERDRMLGVAATALNADGTPRQAQEQAGRPASRVTRAGARSTQKRTNGTSRAGRSR
jgi:hypothetical protein